jgi:hypothetical protein
MPVKKLILNYYKPPDIDYILENLIHENNALRDVIQIYKCISSLR